MFVGTLMPYRFERTMFGCRGNYVMSNPEDEKGNGDTQGEKPSGVSSCGVGPDETQSKSASGRGFESFLPHHDLPSITFADIVVHA